MPYIKDRGELNIDLDINSTSELNYVITKIIHDYLAARDLLTDERLNRIVGVLESVKHEFQRRIVDPYKDGARARNGDVFSLRLLTQVQK